MRFRMLARFAFLVFTTLGLLSIAHVAHLRAFARVEPLPAPSTEGPDSRAASCGAEPFPTGAVVYVCDCAEGAAPGCRRGDDSASGSDEAHPLRTIGAAQARFATLPAGGTLGFCRGGDFRATEALTLVNYACRADAPCTIREYAPPGRSAAALPRLRFAASGLSFMDGGAANHDEGYRVRNLVLEGNLREFGIMAANDVTDIDVCNVTIRNFDIGMYVAGSNPPDVRGEAGPPGRGPNGRIRLHGSRIENNPNQGWLGACVECVVEANLFRGNGSAGNMLNHSIYFDERGSHERVVGNVILENVHDAGGHCQGVGIVVHGVHNDMTIAENHLQEVVGTAGAGCWGIALDPGDEKPERFERIVVRGNRIDDYGNLGIGLAACAECTVVDNVVRQGNSGFESVGVRAPDKGLGTGDARIRSIEIKQNRLVFRGDADGIGVTLGAQGRGHRIVGNTIVHEGRGSLTCFDVPSTGRGFFSDQNVCSARSGASLAWSTRDPSFARARGRGGNDAHSRFEAPSARGDAMAPNARDE